jgi:hypothetical protein
MSVLILIVIIIIFVYFYIQHGLFEDRAVEPFELDPNEKMKRAKQLANSKDLIKSGYQPTKSAFDWMDPIVYEHARKLIHSEQFTTDNILRSM